MDKADLEKGSNTKPEDYYRGEELRMSSDQPGYKTPSIDSHDITTNTPGRTSVGSGRGREVHRQPGQSPSPRSSRDSYSSSQGTPTWTESEARNVKLEPDDPGHWVLNYHLGNLVLKVRPPTRHPVRWLVNMVPSLLRGEKVLFRRSNGPGGADSAPPPRFRVNFAEVQRMKLRKLQCQVVRDVAEMRSHGREAEGWEENLEKYVKALQDYDYMQNRARSNRDPFLVTGEYYTDNYILGQYLSAGLQAQELETAGSVGDWETDDSRQTVCGTRGDNLSRTWFVNFRRRVAIAAVGGLFLVGPMWLMVLYNKLYAQLISTTVFVTAFGIVMAIFLNKDDAVLASTAAYAAVLVVFVGTSTSGDGGAPPSL